MRRLAVAVASAATVLLPLLCIDRADASVVVTIDKSAQRMSVAVNGAVQYTWPVSTGRAPYGTPTGTYSPQMMARRWFSSKYYNSPMPHSIFFYKGYASINKKLVMVPEDAETVRTIFARYLALGSIGVLVENLDQSGIIPLP